MNLKKFNKNLKKEFNNTFEDKIQFVEPKEKTYRRIQLKPIIAIMMASICILLVIQHIGVYISNLSVDNRNEQLLNNTNNEIVKIDSTKNINTIISNIQK